MLTTAITTIMTSSTSIVALPAVAADSIIIKLWSTEHRTIRVGERLDALKNNEHRTLRRNRTR